MTALSKLKVIHFTTDRVPNDNPDGEASMRDFHLVRNALVRACRRHGPTGPMGELGKQDKVRPISILGFWERGDENCIYYIYDDQYNGELYQYMEFVKEAAFTPKWLVNITSTLFKHKGWGLGINGIREAYILVFADSLFVKGSCFENCSTALQVIDAAREQMRKFPTSL